MKTRVLLWKPRQAQCVRAADDFGERLAAHVLHGQVVLAVDLTEVEDLGDVAVAQRHRDFRLVDKHPDEVALPGEGREDFLHHHRLADAGGGHRARPVEFRHPAHGETLEQLVAAKRERRFLHELCTEA